MPTSLIEVKPTHLVETHLPNQHKLHDLPSAGLG